MFIKSKDYDKCIQKVRIEVGSLVEGQAVQVDILPAQRRRTGARLAACALRG